MTYMVIFQQSEHLVLLNIATLFAHICTFTISTISNVLHLEAIYLFELLFALSILAFLRL